MQWRKIVRLPAIISLLLFVAACSGATVAQQISRPTTAIPTIERADTREFIGIRYANESDIAILWSLSNIALPNEIAFCLYGHAADTTMTMTRFMDGEQVDMVRKIAVIDSVTVANIEIARPTFVQFKEGIACDPDPRLIAMAHTHPNIPHPLMGGRCDHSDLDVLYTQNQEAKYWFTLVLCTWTHQMMWADGRRLEYYVQNPRNPLEHPDSAEASTEPQA